MNDAARRLRDVMDDLSRGLSRLESIWSQHGKEFVGRVEGDVLGGQLTRLAETALAMAGEFSGRTSKTS
jgi:hypothetical protein